MIGITENKTAGNHKSMLRSFIQARPARDAIKILVLLLIGCSFLSIIIPPFQSPDEHDHIKRAYLLSKGVLVLEQPEGKASGGYIDSGLLAFMDSYGVNRGKLPKLSAEDIASADAIQWSHQRIYSPAPGTGYYFPAIYLPQGLGLWLGEAFNLSIDHSYRLARTGALIAVALLLYAAFVLHPPSPLLLALIAIPMTLFQISSASLDGISTALTIFSISVFLRIARDQRSSASWLQYSLALAIIILATSRIHALPILALLAATFFYTKSRKSLILFAIACLLISGWTLFALKTTVDLRVPLGDSKHNIALFYLQHPPRFFQVVWHTLSDHSLQTDYFRSFFGILGWRDIQFQDWHYVFFCGNDRIHNLADDLFRTHRKRMATKTAAAVNLRNFRVFHILSPARHLDTAPCIRHIWRPRQVLPATSGHHGLRNYRQYRCVWQPAAEARYFCHFLSFHFLRKHHGHNPDKQVLP